MFWGAKPSDELYDLKADPDNVVNLAGKTEHAEQLAKMRQVLAVQMIDNRDNGLLPEEDRVDTFLALSPSLTSKK